MSAPPSSAATAKAIDDRPSRLWLILSPRVELRRVLRELRERLALPAAAADAAAAAAAAAKPALPPVSARPPFLLLFERVGKHFYLPPELVRIVAAFAPAPAKLIMERACREWKAQVLPRHWVADLKAKFGLDYSSLKPAGRPEPKRLFALLETARRGLVRPARAAGGGGGGALGGARPLAFSI
jgi:hypothetical protein